MKILGISCYYHDSAAALIIDGNIVAAAQEERFSRIKNDQSFPKRAIDFCLTKHHLQLDDLDYIAFYEKPFLTFERILETYLTIAPLGVTSFVQALPTWIGGKLFFKRNIKHELEKLGALHLTNEKILFCEHHLSHTASAFYPSPFDEALILTMDGVGEWATTSIAVAEGSKISIKKEIHFPHSLGLLYSAFTYFCGFKVNSGEYKLMGLAPYGKPTFVSTIKEHLIHIKEDGSFCLNLKYFNFHRGHTMTNRAFAKLFKTMPRKSESEIKQIHLDLAASIQKVLEQVIIKIIHHARENWPKKNLCLAGGVALNCVANAAINQERLFDNIWIQPASGDAGGALGCALYSHYKLSPTRRTIKKVDSMHGSYLGPSYPDHEVEKRLQKLQAVFYHYNHEDLNKLLADKLSQGFYVARFDGAMEFGPRALGNRSILADPRATSTQKNLNLKIKFRESFRPFAPAVLEEYQQEWFQTNIDSAYMLMTSKLNHSKRLPLENTVQGLEQLSQKRSIVPAITHIDYSARLQTVSKQRSPRFYHLLKAFYHVTGCPILVNTSFNIRGEPIVCTPEDAYRCFMCTDLDILVINDYLLYKSEQPQNNQWLKPTQKLD